ncbi:hypothetical protein GTY23_29130 [Streptomyces sp. SID5998]|nr:hypothetical protein [Streptomyces sp. SID5998]
MLADDSILLAELTRRYNERVSEKTGTDAPRPDLYDLLLESLDQADAAFPDVATWSTRKSLARIEWRRRGARMVRRGIAKRYAEAFYAFESALAAGEFVNRSLVHAYGGWMDGCPEGERFPSFFGVDHTVGGKHVKALLLLGMHARSVRIGSEILLLLQEGYCEGAASRARTLYELTVKMLLICRESEDDGWELAERYFVSSRLEAFSRSELFSDSLDESNAALRDVAVGRWGTYLFRGHNNWAAPAVRVSGGRNVTFRDLEETVESESLRHMYLECNHAVHVGALTLIESTDFRRSYLHNCRSEVDILRTGRIGQAAAFYLQMGTMEAAKRLTSDLSEWDWMLSAIDFHRRIGEANRCFFKIYSPRRAE